MARLFDRWRRTDPLSAASKLHVPRFRWAGVALGFGAVSIAHVTHVLRARLSTLGMGRDVMP